MRESGPFSLHAIHFDVLERTCFKSALWFASQHENQNEALGLYNFPRDFQILSLKHTWSLIH